MANDNAEAVIKGGSIVIRVSIANLPAALMGACMVQAITPAYKVTDADVFAEEVVRALNDEDEDGTTAVHRMFDAAFAAAIEDGAEGVDECSVDEIREMGLAED